MTKTLKVIKPFYTVEPDDTFELNEDGMYVNSYNEEHHESNDDSCSVYSSYNSNYTISPDYASILIKDGYLAPETPKRDNKPFVNVFDEIDNMLDAYKEDLKNLNEDMANAPKALKVEKETVLNNLVKALNHLKNLRK